MSRFMCLVHLNVIPGADVCSVKQNVTSLLLMEYYTGNVLLSAVNSSLDVSPVGKQNGSVLSTYRQLLKGHKYKLISYA